MDFTFAFAPLLPLPLLAGLFAITAALALYGLARGIRGSWIRLLAFAAMTLALLNPALLFEERKPLKSVVAIVTDKSGSQKLDGREGQSEAIRSALVERLQKFDMFEIRQAEAHDQVSAQTDVSGPSPLTNVSPSSPLERVSGPATRRTVRSSSRRCFVSGPDVRCDARCSASSQPRTVCRLI